MMTNRNCNAAILLLLMLAPLTAACGGSRYNAGDPEGDSSSVVPGAWRTEIYLPLLEGRSIGMVANQTSLIGQTHLYDSLVSLGLNVRVIFSPEHGFRGREEAGKMVDDERHGETGLTVLSLYGQNRRPDTAVLAGLDVVLFDLQDLGTRFFTYISTLSYLMEACAQSGTELFVLDRPNPNGFYVDGPVLEPQFSSFVGLHCIPVVYGMTIGEYARMVNGEGWLGGGLTCSLTVVPCGNYTHRSMYRLPVPPSPNLPTMNAVYLYPSTCFFEGTVISEGRGTDAPFEIFGHPDLENTGFSFTPESRPGFSTHPKLEGQLCYGTDLRYLRDEEVREPRINLSWLIDACRDFPERENFFIPYFENLAGTALLRQQIADGMTEEEIRAGWQPELMKFKEIRKKYLIYPD